MLNVDVRLSYWKLFLLNIGTMFFQLVFAALWVLFWIAAIAAVVWFSAHRDALKPYLALLS